MSIILNGKVVRDRIAADLRREVARLGIRPTLAIIQVGSRPDSSAYINQKKLFAERVGAAVRLERFPESVAENELLTAIVSLNREPAVHGLIVQLPLPNHLVVGTIIDAIDPIKDVDGLTAANLKLLLSGNIAGLLPATAKGVLALLDYYKIPITGRRAVVIGRSTLVGRPTALALLARDATITICHSKTANLPEVTKQADIIVVAAGRPEFIGKEHVRAGQAVVDVGINVITGEKLLEEVGWKKLVGDVKFDEVQAVVAAISPVPGGVGPMTVASLFENLVIACGYSATI